MKMMGNKVVLLWVFLLLAGCSTRTLQIDATDYSKLWKRAEQEHKNVVVLVTSADCSICHGLLKEWAADREWGDWQKQNVLFCHTELSDPANIFSRLFNTMAVPLVIVLSPERHVKYVNSGFISASRLKEMMSEKNYASPHLDNNLYTTSANRLYPLFTDVLAALEGLKQQPMDRLQVYSQLQNALEIEPYFMNRYLEWKYYQLGEETLQADSCREKLLETLSDKDKVLYVPEIMEMNPEWIKSQGQKLFPKDYYFEWSEKDKEIHFQISYENTLDKPLIVKSVKQSCNCLKTSWKVEPLAPQEKGQIEVIYQNKGEGIFRKSIHIYTNDPNSPYEIALHGRLKK